jgi:hypothetical protein
MNAKDISFADHLISKFHSEHAFFIGMCAGQKIKSSPENIIYLDFNEPHDIKSKKV